VVDNWQVIPYTLHVEENWHVNPSTLTNKELSIRPLSLRGWNDMGNWTGLLSNGFLNIPINAWPILVISKQWQVRYGTFGSIPRVFNRLLHDILPQKYWRHNTCCDASMNTFIKNQWGQVPNSNWKCMIQYLYFSHFSTSPISGWRRLRGSEAPNSVFRLRSTTSVASTIFSRMASSVHQLQSARRSFMISMYGSCQIAELLSSEIVIVIDPLEIV